MFFDQMKNGQIRVILDGRCIGRIHPCPDPGGSFREFWQFNNEQPAENKNIIIRRLCEVHSVPDAAR